MVNTIYIIPLTWERRGEREAGERRVSEGRMREGGMSEGDT